MALRTPAVTDRSSATSITLVVNRSADSAARSRVVTRPSTAMSAPTTVAPSSSRRSAVACPMPDPAPVTRIR